MKQRKPAKGIIAPQYQNDDNAREYLERLLWPDGPVCPHCGLVGEAYKLTPKERTEEQKKADEKKERKTHVRRGVWKCKDCRRQFTVTVNTIFSDSHIPLHKWLLAIHLMCTSKKGISAHQLFRNLELGSYRTAWFMAHRIRWALGQEPIASKLSGIFEIDDTWIGGKKRNRKGERVGFDSADNKTPVTTVLHRGGDVRSIAGRVTGETLRPALADMVDKMNSHVMTDSANKMKFGKYGWTHSSVNHSQYEYARHEDGLTISTNTVEGYFSIIKRGIHGIFHHVGKQYLDMYLREFDYRYNVRKMNDCDRTVKAMKAIRGKRLTLEAPQTLPDWARGE